MREYEPCDMKWLRHKNPLNTICNDLREIYYRSKDESVKLLVRIAISKAKAMDKKLKEYSRKAAKGLWTDNNS
ncbi:MAG: hypothetical protein M0R80_27235 [Proteobacteria bacterium]|jgi:hypothetical protein|nr:hypothetical protein [Pseudomonadota bacterium]